MTPNEPNETTDDETTDDETATEGERDHEQQSDESDGE